MSDNEQERLYRESVAAFEALRDVARGNPSPGTSDWTRWQELLEYALAMNQAYIECLKKSGEPDDIK